MISLATVERELGIGFVPFSPLGHGFLTVSRVEENTAADGIELTAGQISRLDGLTPALGATHEEADMRLIGR